MIIPENLSTLNILQGCLTGNAGQPRARKEDVRIVSGVLSACKLKWEVPDDIVSAHVNDGWVTLEGELEWPYQREAAGNAVKDVEGVKGIYNHITIKSMVQDAADIRRQYSV